LVLKLWLLLRNRWSFQFRLTTVGASETCVSTRSPTLLDQWRSWKSNESFSKLLLYNPIQWTILTYFGFFGILWPTISIIWCMRQAMLKCYYDQIFLQRIRGKTKNAVYGLEISALIPETSKFQKCVKYANDSTDEVINSTKYDIKYINRAISVNLQHRPLKLSMLIVRQATHLEL